MPLDTQLARALAIGAVLLLTVSCSISVSDPVPDRDDPSDGYVLSGELIVLEVGVGPGGGYDQYARLLASHLADRLDVDVTVRNRPGAGGLLSLNQVAAAAPDGRTLTIINGAGMLGAVLAGAEGVEFELDEFTWLGRLVGEPRVLSVGAMSPYTSVEQLLGLETPFTFAASGPSAGAGIAARLVGEALGLQNGRLVYGFEGSEDSALAVTAGEVDGITNTLGPSLASIRAGDHRALAVLGSDPVEELPDVPTLTDLPLTPAGHEIAGSLVALSDAGRILAGPPGMPDDIAAELRAAFAAIVTDQGFLAEAEQQGLEIAWRDHIQVERLIAAALDSPDVVRATLADAQSAD